MAEFITTHPLDAFLKGAHTVADPGVSVEVLKNQGIVQVFAKNGGAKAVETALGIKTKPGKASKVDDFIALPLAQGQWLLVSKDVDENGFTQDIIDKLGSGGYVSEQSDSRVIFRISGPKAVELMQKGCRLDLHPSVTGANWCAQTQMAQIGILIHQVDRNPTYDLYVYSGFAQDFAEWLQHTGAQLGISFSR